MIKIMMMNDDDDDHWHVWFRLKGKSADRSQGRCASRWQDFVILNHDHHHNHHNDHHHHNHNHDHHNHNHDHHHHQNHDHHNFPKKVHHKECMLKIRNLINMKGSAGHQHQILRGTISNIREIQPNINQIQYKILSSNQHQGLRLPNQSCLSHFQW